MKVKLVKQISRGKKEKLFQMPIYYQNLLKYPPESIKYEMKFIKGLKVDMKFIRPIYKIASKLNINIRGSYYKFKTRKEINSDDLYHYGSTLGHTKRYVSDIEAVSNLIPDPYNKQFIKNIENKIKSKNCKKLMCWSNYTRDKLIELMPKVKNKIITQYPAMNINKINKINKKNIKILFVGTEFFNKGGWEVIEAFHRASKENKNINLTVISNIPKKIRNKYKKDKQIKILGLIPREKLYEKIYPKHNLLIFPAKYEAFGLITIEAYSFGMAVLGSNSPVQKELINNKNFIIQISEKITDEKGFFNKKNKKKKDKKKKYDINEVKQIEEKIKLFIKKPELLIKEGKKKYQEVKKGRFSLDKRNKNLIKIYKEAIK